MSCRSVGILSLRLRPCSSVDGIHVTCCLGGSLYIILILSDLRMNFMHLCFLVCYCPCLRRRISGSQSPFLGGLEDRLLRLLRLPSSSLPLFIINKRLSYGPTVSSTIVLMIGLSSLDPTYSQTHLESDSGGSKDSTPPQSALYGIGSTTLIFRCRRFHPCSKSERHL